MPVPHGTPAETISPAEIIRAQAAALGLELTDAQLPGVLDNAALLARYAALVNAVPLPDTCEPAFEYTP
ncbi:DUF4089 domain-containing protein [Acetobacter peroxydans]|jgi:hypothetical protein|uniref:DUF4089 domain-containing protein n=1 Tax=Acetobacter peroxydans TaxID=104098 RepID=UPI002355E6D8|nr:DUF4089 domain-containing protein [Acetobacter peroxydans]MCH4143964.1 DUF4089 domain-containing protein [Acetobacter peroxydans]MCI1395697.1 DUF4089 domain-containing protein [Acetobacter peroxydans]MCI1412008.1 DUF4089 domain-containing protein [Acetobacter peroxydans]MCI1440279.1 DUF4089 domain-containing protein [Acetobacter peroxydans]MCI1567482.1 DUF4089 domain-containing protein [Acetobacter peroxydans]